MEPNELKYWIAFNRVSRVGRARILQLEERFGTLSDAWLADSNGLASAGIDAATVRSIVSSRAKIDPDPKAGEETFSFLGSRRGCGFPDAA